MIEKKKTIQTPLTIFFAKLFFPIGHRIKMNVQKYEFILNKTIELICHCKFNPQSPYITNFFTGIAGQSRNDKVVENL